jgi:predicted nucleic acid-binding protein
MQVVTCPGVLCEVYAALTWEKATPRHGPQAAAEAVRLLVEPPSAIQVLESKTGVAAFTLEIAASHGLTARRIHDAHHAAIALLSGISRVFTYDIDDWTAFRANGLRIVGPPSALEQLETRKRA